MYRVKIDIYFSKIWSTSNCNLFFFYTFLLGSFTRNLLDDINLWFILSNKFFQKIPNERYKNKRQQFVWICNIDYFYKHCIVYWKKEIKSDRKIKIDRVTSWNSSTRFNPIVKTLCTIIVGNWRQTETIKRASSTAYRGS